MFTRQTDEIHYTCGADLPILVRILLKNSEIRAAGVAPNAMPFRHKPPQSSVVALTRHAASRYNLGLT
jgi:hypothetical protein